MPHGCIMRQVSVTPVLPRGEEELRELQRQLLQEEAQEEQEEGATERLEEDRIRLEIEVR